MTTADGGSNRGIFGRGVRSGGLRGGGNPGVVVGVVLVVVGALLLLSRLGVLPFDLDLGDFWPIAPILVGVAIVTHSEGRGGTIAGGVVVLLGVGFLLDNLGVWEFDLGRVWPVFIIAVGLAMVWGATGVAGARRGGTQAVLLGEAEGSAGDVVNRFVALGGAEIKSDSRSFQGGRLSAIMGGIELDLRGASIAGEEAVIEVFALMGGVDIRVPEEWTVAGKVLPLLGGFEDGTRPPREPGKPTKRLVVQGTAVMGGVGVKN